MHSFDYQAPTTLPQALEALAQHNGSARPLAGGTDLIDHMRVGRYKPKVLVDIKKVAELNVLEMRDDGLHIGAAVPCCLINESVIVREQYSALWDCCSIIGGIQIQNRATLGGNLCTSGPAADSIPAMIALNGVCVIAGPNGQRECPVEAFCTAPGANVLQPGELLVEVRFPKPQQRSGSHYRRMIPRNEMDIAVVGVGASVQLEEDGQTIAAARIGLGAVAPTPLVAEQASQVLVGKPAGDDAFQAAGDAARAIVKPITDMRGTSEYRIHVTGVLVRRSLEAAAARARGEAPQYCPGQ